MSQVQFILTDTDPSIQTAISDFVQEEFGQQVDISIQHSTSDTKKDIGAVVEFVGVAVEHSITILKFLPVLTGAITFTEKANRLLRVKKLQSATDSSKKPIYIQIGEEDPIDITQKSADEVVELLEKIHKL